MRPTPRMCGYLDIREDEGVGGVLGSISTPEIIIHTLVKLCNTVRREHWNQQGSQASRLRTNKGMCLRRTPAKSPEVVVCTRMESSRIAGR